MKPKKKSPIVDRAADFEKLLKKAGGKKERYVLQLYITGTTQRSSDAIANIRSLCEEYLPGRYDLKVIDIYQEPEAAGRDQIIAAPTLVKALPTPFKRLVGDLSSRDRVLVGLNLAEKTAAKTKWIKL